MAPPGARRRGVSNQRPPSWVCGGVHGSTHQDLPGFVWDLQLGMVMIGDLPVDGRLSLFLPAWHWIFSGQFVLGWSDRVIHSALWGVLLLC